MNIQCPRCNAQNTFNADEITQLGKKRLCNHCKQPFLIKQKPPHRDRVMVANSHSYFYSTVRDFLNGHGFDVIIAKNGMEALQFLEMERPPVTVVDVALPGMYGFEICDFIKNNEKLNGIKIILLASIYDKTRYKRTPTSIYGADDYIEMHHIPDQLVPKINKLLGKGEGVNRRGEAKEFEAVIIEDETLSRKIKEIAAEDVKVELTGNSLPDKAHEEAKRVARIIMSDIILYNHEAVVSGLREGNLYDLLKDEIREGQAYYAKRVPPEVRKGTSYLKDAFEGLIKKEENGSRNLKKNVILKIDID